MKKSTRTFSWMNPKLKVGKTQGYGKGVFATDNIKKGEILVILGGYIISIEEEKVDSGMQITDDLVLSSFDRGEPADFINHSCNPNCGIKGQNFLVSMAKIKKGEQITFDYAMCLFSKGKKDYYSFECKCGSKNCRLKVTSDDWKNKALQKRYKGYFQWYLQNKIIGQ